jgi:hypothetical protein
MSQEMMQVQPRKKDNPRGLSLEPLEQALAAAVPGREREWASAVGEALSRVESALRQHQAAARAPDGLFAEVDEARPTLARQADRLRIDHDSLLNQARVLREEVRRAAEAFQPVPNRTAPRAGAGVVQFGAIRQQGEALLARLQGNKDAETKLILESINTDIGAGD